MIHWCPPDLFWHVARRLNFRESIMKLSRIRSRVNVSPDLSGVNEPEGLALDCSVKRNNFLEI